MSIPLPDIALVVLDELIKVLAGDVIEDVKKRLSGDPAKKAFEQALGKAVSQYAKAGHISLLEPLFRPKSFLSKPEIARELSRLLIFDGDPNNTPNKHTIVGAWRDELRSDQRDLLTDNDGEMLISYLEDALRQSDFFRPAFMAKDIRKTAETVENTKDRLDDIYYQLNSIYNILDVKMLSQLDNIANLLARDVRNYLRNQSFYIAEKTYGFVGRDWIFNEIANFMNDNESGYYIVIAEAGVGKTSLLAQLVKKNCYVHHFNSRAMGFNRSDSMINNLSAQLIGIYSLPSISLSDKSGSDTSQLSSILEMVSNRLTKGKRCVLVIDALNELDTSLILPPNLPKGIYFVVSHQPGVQFRADYYQRLVINPSSIENLKDIEDFLQTIIPQPGIKQYIARQQIAAEKFIEIMVGKSQGNFMYLYYVLRELTQGSYTQNTLPDGLQNYYEDHWKRMKEGNEDAWYEYKLPIIATLSYFPVPIQLDRIVQYAELKSATRAYDYLQELSAFIHPSNDTYSIYHDSFSTFLKGRDEVMIQLKNLRISEKLEQEENIERW